MSPAQRLQRLRVVLVEPSHEGNIGGAARAMKTMGLSQLWLVRPRQAPGAEAAARASGAEDLLAAARQVEGLEEALVGCGLVIGTSARARRIAWPLLTPDAAARAALAQVSGAEAGEAAIVFGRERSGLSNAELDRCHRLVCIDANPEYSSLNLACATQVLCYELRRAALADGEGVAGPAPAATLAADEAPREAPLANAEEIEGLLAHYAETLVALRMAGASPEKGPPASMLRRLRRLYQRVALDRDEINILRGLLANTLKLARSRREG